jgi:asparagine synthetase B (glutamine-hydrolysing)
MRAAYERRGAYVFQRGYGARLRTFVAGNWSIGARESERVMARAAGVEVRSPFLTRRVVEAALSLPAALRTGGPQEKRVVRAMARGVLPAVVAAGEKEVSLHTRFLRDARRPTRPDNLAWAEGHALLGHFVDWNAVRVAVASGAEAPPMALLALVQLLRCVSWVRAVETRYTKLAAAG